MFLVIVNMQNTLVLIHYTDQYLPLKGGYDFLKGCVDRIEVTPGIQL